MSNVNIEDQDGVAILRLNNNVTNAINLQMVDELTDSLNQVRNKYRGIVFAGSEKFFCIGLDLPGLLKLDRNDMTNFLKKFTDVALELYKLPLPTVCAISGHAIAGGCILALTCDYRFASFGKTKIGMNELNLGIPVPYLADLMLRQIIGDRAATDMLYQGKFLSVPDAKNIGLIDEIFPEEDIEEKALEKVTGFAALSGPAFAATKATRIEAIQSAYEKNNSLKNEIFLDCWFSEPVQNLLIEASSKF